MQTIKWKSSNHNKYLVFKQHYSGFCFIYFLCSNLFVVWQYRTALHSAISLSFSMKIAMKRILTIFASAFSVRSAEKSLTVRFFCGRKFRKRCAAAQTHTWKTTIWKSPVTFFCAVRKRRASYACGGMENHLNALQIAAAEKTHAKARKTSVRINTIDAAQKKGEKNSNLSDDLIH